MMIRDGRSHQSGEERLIGMQLHPAACASEIGIRRGVIMTASKEPYRLSRTLAS